MNSRFYHYQYLSCATVYSSIEDYHPEKLGEVYTEDLCGVS